MNKNHLLLPLAFFIHTKIVSAQDGTLDRSFSDNGKVITTFGYGDIGYAISLYGSDKFVVVGCTQQDFAVARYHENGTLDTTFGTLGRVKTSFQFLDNNWFVDAQAKAVAVQKDGRIIAAGYYTLSTDEYVALVRYNLDGTRDSSFAIAGRFFDFIGFYCNVTAMKILENEKFLVAGTVQYEPNMYVARFNKNGSLDSSFGKKGIARTNFRKISLAACNAMAFQEDGKIVLAGNAFDNFAVTRFNPDGSPDMTFGDTSIAYINLGSVDKAYGVAIGKNGKIFLGGYATSNSASVQNFAVAALLSNGRPDSSFGFNGRMTNDFGFNYEHFDALTLQPDGKLIATGGNDYDCCNSHETMIVARYLTNGDRDPTFGQNGFTRVNFRGESSTGRAVIIDQKQRIMIAGSNHSGFNDFAVCRFANNTSNFVSNKAVLNAAVDLETTGIKVYPNPAKDILTISGLSGGKTFIRLLDVTGKVLVTSYTSNTIHNLPISSLAKGMYYVDVRSEKISAVLSFIKQ